MNAFTPRHLCRGIPAEKRRKLVILVGCQGDDGGENAVVNVIGVQGRDDFGNIAIGWILSRRVGRHGKKVRIGPGAVEAQI